MKRCDVAIITNNSSGINLAINLDRKEYHVALYDVDIVIDGKVTTVKDQNTRLISTDIQQIYDLSTLLLILDDPKIVFIIGDNNVFAEQMLSVLKERLDAGDIVIDCCNTYYEDTANRTRSFEQMGVLYLGTGLVGDTLKQPCLMPGGSYSAYMASIDILQDLSDKHCTYMGPDGAGQFVKMVHDAIEWSILQLISEHIGVLRAGLDLEYEELHYLLCDWNSKETLNSYLLDVVADIIGRYDFESRRPLIDIASDVVGFDLSSSWIGKSAMLLAVPIPTLTEAINVRFLTYMKGERQAISNFLPSFSIKVSGNESQSYISRAESSLYICLSLTYVQGFDLIAKASDMYGWQMNIGDVAQAFSNGSYIKSRMLNRIVNLLKKNRSYKNLLMDSDYLRVSTSHFPSLRRMVATAAEGGYPMPCTFACLSYLDTVAQSKLPTGIIQLASDYINGSGYERIDKDGVFYADWHDPNSGTRSIKSRT